MRNNFMVDCQVILLTLLMNMPVTLFITDPLTMEESYNTDLFFYYDNMT